MGLGTPFVQGSPGALAGGVTPSPFAVSAPPFAVNTPIALAPAAAGFPGFGVPAPWTGFGQAVHGFGGFPGFGGQDISASAPALIGAIALKRGQPMGPANDREIEEFIYDALEWLAGTNDVEARCDNGRVTLTGSVSNKRTKRDIGELAWAIPSATDVQNNVTITARRRGRQDREETQPATTGRKQT